MARMINEVACEPELPPDEMISGTNIASTTACSISVLEVAASPVAVSISPRNSTASHPPRFLSMSKKPISR